MKRHDVDGLTRELFNAHLAALVPILLPMIYLVGLMFDVRLEESPVAGALGAVLLVLGVVVAPPIIIKSRITSALQELPSDKPGDRLSRILQLPRRTELDSSFALFMATLAFEIYACVALDRPWWLLPLGALLTSSMLMLLGLRYMPRATRVLRDVAVEEFHRHPSARADGPKMLFPRLRWYFGFTFSSMLLSSLTAVAALIVGKGRVALNEIVDALVASGQPQVAEIVQTQGLQLAWGVGLPLLGIAVFMLALAHLSALNLGKHYEEASGELASTVSDLATGRPRLPRWISTDEFGDLALGISSVFGRLQGIAGSLQRSASQLAAGAQQLGGTTGRQNETLTRQAVALQETEVTAQEIRQTSLLAAQKTEAVLKTAERATEISKVGEEAIERSLNGLKDIRGEVLEMASRIRALGDRTRQIASITTAVKDLADQSNMLALNAAIEAVRSGEHGKGFGVVAREIRSLADQSIQETNRVREILEDVSEAVRSTVAITERGTEKVETSLEQVQSSGESLRELSGIVKDNAMAVRQIAAAVGQQNAGIGQIFEAVRDLSKMMDDTIDRLKSTESASDLVNRVASEVTAVVADYGVSAAPKPAAEGEAEVVPALAGA